MGAANTGKSMLVSAMLEENDIVPSHPQLCTSRVTSLRAGEPGTRRFRTQTAKNTGEWVSFSGGVPDELVAQVGERGSGDNVLEVEVEVAGVRLLEAGLEVADTPGLHEREDLTERVRKFVERATVVVYVIPYDHVRHGHVVHSPPGLEIAGPRTPWCCDVTWVLSQLG